jgi:hypothetical protein
MEFPASARNSIHQKEQFHSAEGLCSQAELGIESPQPNSVSGLCPYLLRREEYTMGDPRFEYFNISLDSAENRKVVELVCETSIQQMRPNEAEMTPYVFTALMDRAARGEVVRVGGTTDYGLGGGELLLYVVVPLVTNILTAYFTANYVAGIRGLEDRKDNDLDINAELVREYAKRSGVRLKRGEDQQIAKLMRQQLHKTIHKLCTESSPLSIDHEQLRNLIRNAFSLAEMRIVCFDLNEPDEDVFSESEPQVNAMRLIEYFRRRGRLVDLLEKLKIERPHTDWDSVCHTSVAQRDTY